MDEQDSWPAPQAAKKKKKGKIIAPGAGLKGFVDWADSKASDPTEEKEDDMSSLVARFVAGMCKRAASAHGETTPGSKVSGGKRPKQFGPDEEAHKSSVVIALNSPERASDALLALEGAA